nr:Protein C05C10.5, isoform b [Haemonchus contortus]
MADQCASPIPDDPFCPTSSGLQRAKDGNPIPSTIERNLLPTPIRPASPSYLQSVPRIPRRHMQPHVPPLGQRILELNPIPPAIERNLLQPPIRPVSPSCLQSVPRIPRRPMHLRVPPSHPTSPPIPRSVPPPFHPTEPTQLPGVEAFPMEESEMLLNYVVPGEYQARSMTQILGPFDCEPTIHELPSGDTYFILRSMGRHPRTGKRIWVNIRQLTVPPKPGAPSRPISPRRLPGITVRADLDIHMKNHLVPGNYYAKSMTRYLGPFAHIPSDLTLPRGDSYAIFQEMKDPHGNDGMILRHITQIDT